MYCLSVDGKFFIVNVKFLDFMGLYNNEVIDKEL